MNTLKTFQALLAVALLMTAMGSIPANAQMPDIQQAQSKNKDKAKDSNKSGRQSAPTSVPEPSAAWILLPVLGFVGLRERRRKRPAVGRRPTQ